MVLKRNLLLATGLMSIKEKGYSDKWTPISLPHDSNGPSNPQQQRPNKQKTFDLR